LQSALLVQQRCPKCTLVPPCKHYNSAVEVSNDADSIINSAGFKTIMSPSKRENLLRKVKEAQHQPEASQQSIGLMPSVMLTQE